MISRPKSGGFFNHSQQFSACFKLFQYAMLLVSKLIYPNE